MSTDQINATFWATIIQTVAVCLQTLLAVGAIILAVREIGKWRKELLGSKKVDLAIKLGAAATAIGEAFKYVRSNIYEYGGAPEYEPNSTREEKRQQDLQYRYNQKLKLLQSKITPIYEIQWEMSALFDDYEVVQELIKQYNIKFAELSTAMEAISEGEATKQDRQIVVGSRPDNEFSREVEAITSKLRDFAIKHIRTGK